VWHILCWSSRLYFCSELCLCREWLWRIALTLSLAMHSWSIGDCRSGAVSYSQHCFAATARGWSRKLMSFSNWDKFANLEWH
jgi:hypothetical protein